MKIQVFLFLFITGAYGCGKSAPENYRKTMGYPSLTYSFGEGGVHPSPRVEPYLFSLETDFTDESCLKIRHEWNQLRKGLTQDWFPTEKNQSPPAHSPLFKFTCQNQTRKDEKGFVIPTQLKAPSIFTMERRSSAVETFDNLFPLFQDLFQQFTTNAGKQFAFLISRPTNPVRGFEEPVTVESHKISVEKYEIALENPADISSNVKDAYFACGDDDLVCMDQFLAKYGTHVYHAASFGGRLEYFFQRVENEFQGLQRNLRSWTKSLSEFILQTNNSRVTSAIYFEGGQQSISLTPDEWAKSVEPTVVISKSVSTICEAIDPTGKRLALRKTCIKVVGGIKTRYRANRLLSAFRGYKVSEEIKNILQNVVEDEASRIIPRVKNLEKIENLFTQDGRVGGYFAFCRIHDEKEAVYTDWKYPLRSDFCVSAGENFEFHGCKVQDSSLPPLNCIKLYKKRGCVGESGWFEIAKGFEKLEGYSSYMVC